MLRRLAPSLLALCLPATALAEGPGHGDKVATAHAAPDAHVAPAARAAQADDGVDSDLVLAELRAGNARFVDGKPKRPRAGKKRVAEVAKGQHPEAIVLGCSDSRVVPEIIFDQGLGDLFVVRVAGNVSEPATLGSIEYAASHLGAHVIVVLGHTRCGAVKATCEGGEAPGNVGALVSEIAPAVSVARLRSSEATLVDDAVHVNERVVVDQLMRESDILANMLESGELRIVVATYDLDTGVVDWR